MPPNGEQDKYIGTTVGRFRIEKKIGKGGMGAVYLGIDEHGGDRAAVKILPEEALGDEEMVRRFQREARIVEEIRHPNVAQLYESGTLVGATPYYAMEYIEGRSLAQILDERGRVTGRYCVEYLRQTAMGLHAAAERIITHRDIKPANIMITNDGVVKIVDFGIAKAYLNDSFKTVTGQVMGTAAYMSPEQAKGKEVDLRSDIYSLGATFYHVVTGRMPFEGETIMKVMMKQIRETPRPIKELNPNVPSGMCAIINKMMEKNPDNRYQDYYHLLAALDHAFSDDVKTVLLAPAAYTPDPEYADTTKVEKKFRFNLKKALLFAGAVAVLALAIITAISAISSANARWAASPEKTAMEARKKEVQQEREAVGKEMINSLKAIQENLSDRKPAGE